VKGYFAARDCGLFERADVKIAWLAALFVARGASEKFESCNEYFGSCLHPLGVSQVVLAVQMGYVSVSLLAERNS
jgi:hypothetical protein